MRKHLILHGEKEEVEVVDDFGLVVVLGKIWTWTWTWTWTGLVLHLPDLSDFSDSDSDFPICSLSLDRPVENRDVSGRTREGGRTKGQSRGT